MAIHGTTHPHAPTRRHLCPPTTGRAGEIAPPPSAFWAFALLLPQLYCMRLPCWAFVFYRCEFRRMISSRLSLSGPKLPKPTHIRRSPNRSTRQHPHSGVGTVRKWPPLWAGLIPGPILCRPPECRRSRQFPRCIILSAEPPGTTLTAAVLQGAPQLLRKPRPPSCPILPKLSLIDPFSLVDRDQPGRR